MDFKLRQNNRDKSNLEIIDDLKKVAKELNQNHLTQDLYNKNGRFTSSLIKKRFATWNKGLELAELKAKKLMFIDDCDIIEDLKRIAILISPVQLTIESYDKYGKYSSSIVKKRFGWNKALINAGLTITKHQNINEIELLENLKQVWIKLGKQPSKEDMVKSISKYSAGPYILKYGTWGKSLDAFIQYINSNENKTIYENRNIEKSIIINSNKIIKHRTSRKINDRMKVQILMREGNRCKLCGVEVIGRDIHFDHIKPWSKGGETVLENIQILCAHHNLVKGDFEF